MKSPVKTPTALIREYRDLMGERLAHSLAMAKGASWGVYAREKAYGEKPNQSIVWILNAHVGTLDKLPRLLPEGRLPTSLELLSAVRNLFENLIWLRLFEQELEYGLKFYARLLEDQIEDLKGLLAKNEQEAALFRDLANEDDEIVATWAESIKALTLPDEDGIAAAQDVQRQSQKKLDAKARRSFSLHAAAAALNGFEYQIHLIKNKESKRIGDQLATIESRLNALRCEIADEARFRRITAKFVWRDEARRVGMLDQYDYLYRLTSRLLHSSPMNIITEKELSQAEQTLLLEYMFVAASDVLDIIDRFDFPNRTSIAMLEMQDAEGDITSALGLDEPTESQGDLQDVRHDCHRPHLP